jgi:HK97 family phage portal protein
VLETDQPVNQEQALIIKARFAAATRGREPVVLGAGTKYRPITVPPDESQFLDTIRATATQVAAIFGVPADKIGGEPGGSMTYANVEQAALDFVTFTLRPYLVRIETMLTGLLPRPQIVKANADALIRADALTRYQAHHLALSDGWQSRDEIRRIEDLPPIPGGDQYAPIPTPAAPGPAIPPAGGDEA